MATRDGWSEDTSPADWVVAGWERSHGVTQMVPRGFDAHLRILHPALIIHDDSDIPVWWSAVAAWSGLPLHRRASWASITVGPQPLPDEEPFTQSPNSMLTSEQEHALVDILAHNGHGQELCWMLSLLPGRPGPLLQPADSMQTAPPEPIRSQIREPAKVTAVNGFEFDLFRVPLADAVGGAFCWPDDRSWFLGGSADLPWTYLGGATDLIARVDADDRLETMLVDLEDPTGCVESWLDDAARATARQIVATGRGTLTTSQGTTNFTIVPTTKPDVFYLREGTEDHESGYGVIGAEQINEDYLTDNITFGIASLF